MRRPTNLSAVDLTVAEIVLLQAASNPEGVHGYGMIELFGKDKVTHGTIYRRLGKLANQGFLDSKIETEEDKAGRVGPPRRVFSITDEGQYLLKEAMQVMGVEVEEIIDIDLTSFSD